MSLSIFAAVPAALGLAILWSIDQQSPGGLASQLTELTGYFCLLAAVMWLVFLWATQP